MGRFFQELMKLVIVICFTAGVFLVFKMFYHQYRPEKLAPSATQTSLTTKAEILKRYLLANGKPQRIEVTNLSARFEKDVQEIKKIKIAQDSQSSFYLAIQFFTDEGDAKAPLIAQIRFIDVKSGNTLKEESLNLE